MSVRSQSSATGRDLILQDRIQDPADLGRGITARAILRRKESSWRMWAGTEVKPSACLVASNLKLREFQETTPRGKTAVETHREFLNLKGTGHIENSVLVVLDFLRVLHHFRHDEIGDLVGNPF